MEKNNFKIKGLFKMLPRLIKSEGFIRFTKRTLISLFIFWTVVVGTGLIYLFGPWASKTEAVWADDNYNYRILLTVDNTKVAGASDLTDFPILVSLSDATNLGGKFQDTTGNDIFFTKFNGERLSHEIELATSATGIIVAWVKIPTLATATDTPIYMYFGNPSAVSQARPTQVWDSNYKMVQHLKESPDNSAGQIKDSTVNANNGTTTSMAAGSSVAGGPSGNLGKGFDFDGSADLVDIADSASLDITSNITIEAWIKADSFANYLGIASKQSAAGTENSWRAQVKSPEGWLYWETDADGSGFDTGIGPTATYAISTATWYHVVFINNTSTTKQYIYINGTAFEKAQGGGVSIYSGAGTVTIGANAQTDNRNWFDGIVDEFRVSNTVRSADWITTEYNNQNSPSTFYSTGTPEKAPSPVAYWKFDDTTVGTAEDSTTNALDGTHNNTPTIKTEDFCISAKCLYFDGANNENVSLADNAKLDFAATDNFTVSAWVKRNGVSATNPNYIITKHDVTDDTEDGGYKLWMDADGDLCFGIDDDITWDPDISACSTNANFDDDKWHFVSGVRDQTGTDKIYVYVDGVEKSGGGTSDSTTLTLANSNIFYVGVDRDGTSNEWLGFMDEVKVYSYARSAAQVQADYNARSNNEGASAVLGASNNRPAALSNGLVGYWKMDESSGNATDSSGNGGTGTNTNIVTYTAGKFGNAGTFASASSQYFSVADTTTLKPTTAVTVSAWVNSTSNAPNGFWPGVVMKTTDTSNLQSGYGFRQVSNTNTMQFFAGSGSSACGSSIAGTALNEWHYWVFTYQSGVGCTVYKDGVSVDTGSSVGDISNTASALTMGRDAPAGTSYFTGKIDEARVYNRALSNNEVSQLYNFAPGPVGYWKMDEGTWTNDCATAFIIDSSGNGNNGKSCPNGTGTTPGVPGKYGKAGSFDGVDDYITMGQAAAMYVKYVTAEAWVKTTSTAGGKAVADTGGGAAKYSYNIFVNTNGTARWEFDGASLAATNGSGTKVINDGNWHHLAIAYDGAKGYLYVDGALDTSGAYAGGDLEYDSGDFTIGKAAIDGEPLNAKIDEVRVYGYARTQGQIIEDMNAGHPAPGSPVGTPLGYWKFDEGTDNTCSGGTNDACNSGSQGSALDGAESGMSVPATATSGWTQSGKFGKALNFDGTDDYALVSHNASLNLTANFTISHWVYPREINADNSIVTKGDGSAAANTEYITEIGRGATSGRFSVFLRGSWYDVNSVVSANTWQHLAVTYDGTNLRFYVNGLLRSTQAASGTYATTTNIGLYIGRQGSVVTTNNTEGLVDEIKIYNFALTDDQMKLDMNRGSSQVLGALSDNSSYQKNAANQEYCVPGDSTSCAAPVGRWDFEEGTGITANDVSGTANTGTIAGSASYIRGKDSKGLNFDGTDDAVSVGDSPSIDVSTGMTLEFWVKSDTTGSGVWRGLVGKTTDFSNLTTGFGVRQQSGSTELQFWLQGATGTSVYSGTNYDLPNNQWHHVAMTYTSGSGGAVYKDGQRIGTLSDKGNIQPTANPLIFGRNPEVANFYFDGTLDQIRLFNYARSAAQIAWDYNKGGPVGYWRLDDCQGTTAIDSSGNGNTGTITIGASGTQTSAGTCAGSANEAWKDGVTGKRNYSLDFDGTDDYIAVAEGTGLKVPANFTVSAWIKPGTQAGSSKIMSRFSGGCSTAQFEFYVSGTTAALGLFNTAGNCAAAVASGTISLNQWVHVTGTFDGTNVRLYINGNLVNTSSSFVGSFNSSPTASFAIGSHANQQANTFFNGQIDDARIYNYALTATQVKTLYTGGALNFAPSTGAP